ncbi:MAG: hypothetical protein GX780_01010 [Campylobacteraceae bacterium]|nr:hypothetical protein [Campylobacteraceae bacterium]
MKEKEFEIIGGFIADILDDIENKALQAEIKNKVKSLASNFIIYKQATY